jgi:glycosyltransferase involved in cell wall biosynthesis
MPNVLFIARIFPPATGSAVQRPVKFAKYCARLGWRPFVVTCQDEFLERDESLCRDISSDVRVCRVFSPEPQLLRDAIVRKWKRWRILSLFLRAINKVYSIAYYRIAFPDWFAGWIPAGFFAAARLLKKEGASLVYVHSQPPSSLVIGLLLKKIYRVSLVLDYDDPWTTSPDYFPAKGFRRKAGHWLEELVLKSADRIVYCKESIRGEIMEQFRGLDSRLFVFIPNGYDPEDYHGSADATGAGKLKIVYTGKMTRKFCYSPESLFSALKAIKEEGAVTALNIEVCVAGLVSPEYTRLITDLNIQDMVHFEGYLDHARSVALIEQADALLLVIESRDGIEASAGFAGSMPAKIFEYMFTGKPVLAIVPPGPEEQLLRDAGIGFIARPNDPVSVKRALMEVIAACNGTGGKAAAPDREFIRQFDRSRQAEKLVAEFETLLKETCRSRAE